jgi:1-deoxy-D-xylulose-5-phosphate reductoisomerase
VKRIALLGATGSIGRQAVEIVAAHPELELCAAASGTTPLDDIAAPLKQVGGDLGELLERAEPDVVLNAVVGFAGIHATLWALEGRAADEIDALVLTGSGGPFRGKTREELVAVTPEEALAHPTWRMGRKITVDSATLANKGLELIEAHFLFDVSYDRIEVVLQPTSIVHSLVRLRDGAALAHLGYPDMRVPISYALQYPERPVTPLPQLDLTSLTLEFEAPDLETFPLLALAREAGARGGTYPCVYNAANEVAVAAFLAGRLPFLGIPDVVADALARADGSPARDLDELVEADRAARAFAGEGLPVA